MSKIWAIARHMVSEVLRMKIAVVFLILIGAIVVGLPFSVSGDRSLTGSVQAFLSYALTATGVILGTLTIFMSRSLSDELLQRQIFLVLTKPISRWQYVLGKWVGMMLLNASFLLVTGVTVYGMVHYIRWTHPPIDPRFDKLELESEVLVARHTLQVKTPDFRQSAEREFQHNLEDGLYDNLPDNALEGELGRLANKHEARWRVVGPLDQRVFEFDGILCDRSPESSIQIRYKAEVSGYAPDEVFRALWRIGDPMKGTPLYQVRTRHAVGRYHTLQVPADAVAEDHTLVAHFFNRNPFGGEIQYNNVIEFRKRDGVEVLFVVGSFEGNLLRVLMLIMCKLMFLGAVAVLAATVFSFPVASLASFVVYILAGTRRFISESLDSASDDWAGMFDSVYEFAVQSFMLLYEMLLWIIPDFGYYDGVETLVNGGNVGLYWVLQGVSDLVLIKSFILLGLAMLLFQRREVAEVSV